MKNYKKPCEICKKSFCNAELFPLDLIRNSFLTHIKTDHPDLNDKGYICNDDLKILRGKHIENIILEDKGDLSDLDKEVLDSLKEHDLVTEDINAVFQKELTFGEKAADKLARFAGSWGFITSFIFVLVLWILVNLYYFTRPFDPYPFILLNLILSCLAAMQAPVIMMSQNRQVEKDRLQSEDDYRTNLKSELEIRQLHSKMDVFMKKQWDRLFELQQIQIDLMEDLANKKK